MVKFMAIMTLRPGADPDEAYKVWRESHAEWAKKLLLPEIKKYLIYRVTDKLNDNDVYGITEAWYDTREDALRAMGRLMKAKPDVLLSKYIFIPKRVLLSEEEIKL